MWPDTQDDFADALLRPDAPSPAGIDDARGRFAVYRNNVLGSLGNALGETYPVVSALVGEEFFAAATREFVRCAPPATPVLAEYGQRFADFVSEFEPAATVPYLADVARLEWAWLSAYHAADMDPVGIGGLAALPEDAVDNVSVRPHPSATALEFSHPAVTIWQAHQTAGPIELGVLPLGPEYALVVRPGPEVIVHALDAPTYRLARALLGGVPLGRALAELEPGPATDPSAALARLFTAGAVADLYHDADMGGDILS